MPSLVKTRKIHTVVARLQGGLGNQMFQYAAARALSLRTGSALKLHVCTEAADRPRVYGLKHFNIQEQLADAEDLRRLKKSQMRIVRERSMNYDEAVLGVAGDVYLEGYWQSPKYFEGMESVIRQEFSVKYPLEGQNLESADSISGTAAVSVHVRRDDYVKDPRTRAYHGICGADYYQKAIQRVSQQVPTACFYFFSDDPQWVREFLLPCAPKGCLVEHNGEARDYEDLRLMSLCRHHIVANSSFSWWGAWLSRSPDKIVCAPARWFSALPDPSDLIPASWMRL